MRTNRTDEISPNLRNRPSRWQTSPTPQLAILGRLNWVTVGYRLGWVVSPPQIWEQKFIAPPRSRDIVLCIPMPKRYWIHYGDCTTYLHVNLQRFIYLVSSQLLSIFCKSLKTRIVPPSIIFNTSNSQNGLLKWKLHHSSDLRTFPIEKNRYIMRFTSWFTFYKTIETRIFCYTSFYPPRTMHNGAINDLARPLCP